MKFPVLKKIVLRLYNFYVKEHFDKIVLALFLSFGVAGGTAAIAWLLDPAIKKIFIDQDSALNIFSFSGQFEGKDFADGYLVVEHRCPFTDGGHSPYLQPDNRTGPAHGRKPNTGWPFERSPRQPCLYGSPPTTTSVGPASSAWLQLLDLLFSL